MKFLMLLAMTMSLSFAAHALTKEEETLAFESYSHEAKGDYTQAIAKMNKIFDKNSDDYFVNYRLGWLFSVTKKYENATSHYEKAAKVSSQSLAPWLALSLLNLNLGFYEKSLSSCEEILKRDPNNYYGLMRSISANIKLKKFEEGLTFITKALDFYPADEILLEQKGYILTQLKKKDEAKVVLSFLHLISPSNLYAKSILGIK